MTEDFRYVNFSVLLADNRTALMGISIVCIMLYHQNWFSTGLWTYVQLFGYIGVEVFLIISGFGLAHSLEYNCLGQYYKNRFLRLFPACLVFGVIKVVMQFLPFVPKSNMFFLWDLLSISHWYIYAIIIYYIVAPLVNKAVKRWGWKPLVVVAVLSYGIVWLFAESDSMNYFVKYGRWVIKRFPVFVLGMTIAHRPLKLNVAVLIGFITLVLNLICFRYVVIANASPDIQTLPARWFTYLPNRTDIPDHGLYLLNMLSGLFLSWLFAVITRIFKFIHLLPVLTWLGSYSLELYLCHQFIFKVVDKNIQLDPICLAIISLIIVLATALLIKQIAPFLRSRLERNVAVNRE